MGAPLGGPHPAARRRDGRRLAPFSLVGLLGLTILYFSSGPSERSAIAGAPRRSMLDIASPVGVHGHLNKAGPLAVVSMLGEGHKWSDLLFPPDWVKQRLEGNKVEPPSKYCNPMINDKYKFIYVKCPKTGGTTVMDGYFSHCDLPRHYDWCLHMADYTNLTEVAHLNRVWGEYFVFGFSRNVLRRAISQFQYLSTFVKEECGPVAWDDYCRDPYMIGDICARTDAKGESCCTLVPEHQYLHVSPQANCLATSGGQLALDWLGRVEHFYEDFEELVAILNSRKGVPKLPEELPGRLNTNADRCGNSSSAAGGQGALCNHADFFTGAHAHCLDSISQFYAEDISLLAG